MTFKTTSENLNHIGRVGSASTRPHANGRIDLVPADAREPEDYYNSIRDQYLLMSSQQRKVQDDLAALNKRLKETLPWDEFKPLADERDRLRALAVELQNKCTHFRVDVRQAGKVAWSLAFHAIAKRVLDRERFIELERQTNEALGRSMTEVAKGGAELSERAKDSDNKAKHRRERRKAFRERYFGADTNANG